MTDIVRITLIVDVYVCYVYMSCYFMQYEGRGRWEPIGAKMGYDFVCCDTKKRAGGSR